MSAMAYPFLRRILSTNCVGMNVPSRVLDTLHALIVWDMI